MEDKTFEKDKVTAVGEGTSQAGQNRRRRRRKKRGAKHAPSSTAPRAAQAGEPSAAREENASPTQEEKRADAAADSPQKSGAEQASAAMPAQPPAAPDCAQTAPETPQPPETAEMAEPACLAEAAEPASERNLPETETASGEPAETETASGEPAETETASEEPAETEGAAAPDPEEQTPEQRRRAAEMTRTVQISIEKIVENMDGAVQAGETADSDGDGEADEAVPLTRMQRLHRAVGDGAWALLKWLAFVVAFVAVVAGGGIAWLYQGATPDSIPEVSATFNGQELEPVSYSWHVPVVANVFKRTYAETVSKEPVRIEETVQVAQVELEVAHTSCDTTLTVENSAGEIVFEGTAEEFGNYTFTQNDTYTAELVVYRNERQLSHTAEVSGQQTYWFTFTVSLRPTIRLNTASATQGGVVAVRVSGGAADDAGPVLTTELTATAFLQGTGGWVCYLPVAVDQEPGVYTITVSYAGYTQELSLTVKARSGTYKDYSTRSQLTSPYISEEDTPAEVLAVLSTGGDPAAWGEDGFVLPFADSAEVELAYGTTEYVGRTRSERTAGTGTGRVCTNVVVSTARGGDLMAPAAGTVVLAEDLGDTAGYTVVIDHGGGVTSIFYCLRDISVEVGDSVVAGQVIAETNRTTIGEVRVGTVPVDPLTVWNGNCDALRHY